MEFGSHIKGAHEQAARATNMQIRRQIFVPVLNAAVTAKLTIKGYSPLAGT